MSFHLTVEFVDVDVDSFDPGEINDAIGGVGSGLCGVFPEKSHLPPQAVVNIGSGAEEHGECVSVGVDGQGGGEGVISNSVSSECSLGLNGCLEGGGKVGSLGVVSLGEGDLVGGAVVGNVEVLVVGADDVLCVGDGGVVDGDACDIAE